MKKIEYTPEEYEMNMFEEMEGKYISENERQFFERLKEKIQTEYASAGELLIDCDENPDGYYLYREIYDDFRLGRDRVDVDDNPVMTNGLFGILSIDLSDYYPYPGHFTLLDWLRKNDYKYVRYDRWEG